MEDTSFNSMNDEDEGIPDSPHSSLSSGSHENPYSNRCTSVNKSTYGRSYSDTDSAFGDVDCNNLLNNLHVAFYFVTSASVSSDNLCKWLRRRVKNNQVINNSGYILKSLEQGVNIPVMYSQVITSAQGDSILSEKDRLDTDINVNHAVYRKIDSIGVPVISNPTDDNSSELRHILIGFKHIQSFASETFEDNWKEMSGIRSLYLDATSCIGLSEINYFKRISSNIMSPGEPAYRDICTFSHIVQIIFNTACGEQEIYLHDLLHRLRLRMLGFTSVYSHISIVNV